MISSTLYILLVDTGTCGFILLQLLPVSTRYLGEGTSMIHVSGDTLPDCVPFSHAVIFISCLIMNLQYLYGSLCLIVVVFIWVIN